ncbi:MAG: hypothetical protein WC789_06515 [Lentisphaeria bacterium]|jgi:hypothetical protein
MPLAWNCSQEGLAPELLAALAAAAAAFAAAGGPTLTVTSGRRTLRRQAELMAAMSEAQLRELYARAGGTPDYLAAILARRAAGAPCAAEAVETILQNRREGFVSAHLCGAAVDLALTPDLQPRRGELRALLEAHGFATLDETEAGIPCLHCRLRALPLREVRA